MELLRVRNVVVDTLLNSASFPYRTGFGREHYFDNSREISTENTLTTTMLDNPEVRYMRILEVAPSIRYRIRKINKHEYDYIKHQNRHFRYIERIIDNEGVQAIESEFGVRYEQN